MGSPHHRLAVGNAPGGALPGQDVCPGLRHVRPAAVLRRVVDLEAVGGPRRLRRPGRPVQGRQPVGVGLSITGTILRSGKWTSAMSAGSPAKSRLLRRSVTFTWRHASSGAYTMNRCHEKRRRLPSRVIRCKGMTMEQHVVAGARSTATPAL